MATDRKMAVLPVADDRKTAFLGSAVVRNRSFASSLINDAERIVLEDDHLRKHLECIQAGNLDAVMRYFLSPANSMSIYDLLDTLYRSKFEEECIPDDVANYYSEVGERAGVI